LIFKYEQLVGIRSGSITLAFRRWEKLSVKKGSTVRTEMGVTRIDEVVKIDEDEISKKDAINAGFESVDAVLNSLRKGPGSIYKIKLSYQSADPRISLRSQTTISEEEFQKIKIKLDRLDKTRGPWVMKTLQLIGKYPERRAGDLADMIGMERMDFKLNVRKLKNLGLTISHEVGYSISPLGNLVMTKLAGSVRTRSTT